MMRIDEHQRGGPRVCLCGYRANAAWAEACEECGTALGELSASEGEELSAPDDADMGEEKAAPRRQMRFAEQTEHVLFVPLLEEWDAEERRATWWSHRDYAQIRARQRELILMVLKQAHEYPEGVVPPPFPGESRRGLGLCCEPGTVGGRAARVKFGRQRVVEAHRAGCPPEELSQLSEELSQWASKNARDVGLKDESATIEPTADYARTFFLHGSCTTQQDRLISGTSHCNWSSSSAAAKCAPNHNNNNNNNNNSNHQTNSSCGDVKPSSDGCGLASMVRTDSLGNLSQVAQDMDDDRGEVETPVSSPERKSFRSAMIRSGSETRDLSQPGTKHLDAPLHTKARAERHYYGKKDDDDDDVSKQPADGFGLASMIRNDSFSTLQHAAEAASIELQG